MVFVWTQSIYCDSTGKWGYNEERKQKKNSVFDCCDCEQYFIVLIGLLNRKNKAGVRIEKYFTHENNWILNKEEWKDKYYSLR